MHNVSAALAVLPMILGCIIGGILMEVYGRRMCLMLSCVPFTIGWVMFLFAKNVPLILVGRFITGTITGIITPPITVYIGESTDPKYRGILLAGLSLGQAFGVLWAHLMGSFFSWKIVGLICGIVPIVGLIQMVYVPESPVWLAKKDKTYQARMAFHWCRGNSEKVEKELARMLEINRKNAQKKSSWRETFKSMLDIKFLKPFFILCVFMTTSQWSGNNAITFYTISIIKQTIGGEFNEYLCMIIVDIVRMILSILACYLVESMGRRTLTILSGFGSGASLLSLALITYLSENGTLLPQILPLIALALFMAFVTVGFVPVPWALVGEIFPVELRSFGSGSVSVVAFFMMFSVVKTGPFMFEEWGSLATYIIYGMTCVIGTGILTLILPETKGKILQDIEGEFELEIKEEKKTTLVQNS